MGSFARGCVSPVAISGGTSSRPARTGVFRQPAEPRHGAEHLRSSPRQARSLLDIRAAFWYGPWEGRQACDGCDDRIQGRTFDVSRASIPRGEPRAQRPMLSSRMPKSSSEARQMSESANGNCTGGARSWCATERGCWSGRGPAVSMLGSASTKATPKRPPARCTSRRLASARCRAEPAAGALWVETCSRDRLADHRVRPGSHRGTRHVAAATRRAVLVAGSSKGCRHVVGADRRGHLAPRRSASRRAYSSALPAAER